MISKTWSLGLLGVMIFIGCATAVEESADCSHYNIRLELDPPNQYLNVAMDLTVVSADDLPDTLVFGLNHQFTNIQVTGDGIDAFIFDLDAPPPSFYSPDARPLLVILDKAVPRDKPLTLSFAYEGKLTDWNQYSANVLTEEWVELGLYISWVPMGAVTGEFTFEIEAECDPSYQLRSFGDYTYENGLWNLSRMIPTFDLLLFASKDMKTMEREAGGKKVYLHYQALEDTTAEKFIGDLSGIFDKFDELYGGDKKGNDFTLIVSPREMGGGYARVDLITMTWITDAKYVTDREFLYRYLAHETGHFWWSMAPTDSWEDWMNEGFAEYSAQLAVRETFGEEVFRTNMEEKRAASAGTTPIWGFNRNEMTESGRQAPIIEINLYKKAPVLLLQLSERIGAGEFNTLCKIMVTSNVSSTDDFLNLMENNYGENTKSWFENLLKTY